MKKRSDEYSVQNNDTMKVSAFGALWLHLMCGFGVAIAFWVAHQFYSINLISDPAHSLLLVWIVECPIVILLYSLLRDNSAECSYLKAVGRGILGLPAGALVIALGGIALGAPIGTRYLLGTINWSLLMSLFTFAPAAAVFGSSWADWRRIFANTRPVGSVDYMLCLPAHGAVIGSWFGAWPMPLDWERPWQEWPVCVTYGGLAGYVVGMVASLCFVIFSSRRPQQQHVKAE
ncbi:hypothetical protein Nepgr_019368 [Nepenthes gracilis]|uniref:Phosphatidylinositol-glycan biosynthesis class F protein n=1 Tax=Nepenthes gracilis TaxID=150966 RepID=A0AAD3SUS2_NEPGR|nr:hypothetical protein Nepgr_019368 [Nepenthes gracilis]